MSGFLLDTNVISELIRKKADSRVVKWIDSTNDEMLYLSVLTCGEIRKGISLMPSSAKRTSLETWLEIELTERFADRILLIDRPISERWGRLVAEAGRPVSILDAFLGATALHHDLTLVTRNVKDLQGTGVPLFNPWQD